MSKLLEFIIKEQAQKYYTDGSNDLADTQFDELVDLLKKINPDSSVLTTGWGYDPNQDTTYGKKVKHKYGLVGSLDKIHSYDDLTNEFKSSPSLYTSLKLDGLSVVLYYKSGVLYDAVTRGDGTTGISIYDKIAHIDKKFIHTPLSVDFTGAIRGEILMSYDNFKEFKKFNPDAKNPRNVTAGLINRKGNYDDLKYLNIILYNIVGCENEEYIPHNFHDVIIYLKEWFGSESVVPNSRLDVDDSESFQYNMDVYKKDWYGKYPADGIVINLYTDYNTTTHYVSYTSVAYKYPSETASTFVSDINWNMSKTGYAIPTIQVFPVELSGTMVMYATGFNAQYIKDNNIGIGTKLVITKAGEIIPYVKQVLEPTAASIPNVCPECGHTLKWNGVHLCCDNLDCPNIVRQDLLVWINNLAPIDNFGDSLRLKYIYGVFDTTNVSIEMLMTDSKLREYVANSIQDNMFKQMCNKLTNGRFSLKSVLLALNIPRLGDKTCEKLSHYPNEVKRIISVATKSQDAVELLDLNGYIGDANADSIRENLWKFTRLNLILGRIDFSKVSIKGQIAVTGKLSIPRKQFEQQLLNCGYTVGNITKTTKYLITDDPKSNSSKNIKADKLGIPKLTEQEFRKQFMN